MADVKPSISNIPINASVPEVQPKPLPKPTSQSFSGSFESFLQQKKSPESNNGGGGSGSGNKRVNHNYQNNSTPSKRTNGNTSDAIQDDLKDGGPMAQTSDINKWGQSCDNCAALVHLMYNHLSEISRGDHHAIQDGTTSADIINHLAVALGYNERQIQRLIQRGENPYRCRHCAAAFGTRLELNGHINDTHADIATIPCPECDKWYKTQESMQSHFRNVHKPPPVKDFRCPVRSCGTGYATYGTLKRHVQKKHPEIPLPVDTTPKQPIQQRSSRGRGGRGRGRRGRGRGRGFSSRTKSSTEEESEFEEESDEYYQSSNQAESDESIGYQEDRF